MTETMEGPILKEDINQGNYIMTVGSHPFNVNLINLNQPFGHAKRNLGGEAIIVSIV